MTDQLISIRVPKPLAAELKRLVHENHYLDLSEELRSIIRQYARNYLDPTGSSTQKLQTQLEKHILSRNEELKKQELLRELKNILGVDQ